MGVKKTGLKEPRLRHVSYLNLLSQQKVDKAVKPQDSGMEMSNNYGLIRIGAFFQDIFI
jgi:hypothetical protein